MVPQAGDVVGLFYPMYLLPVEVLLSMTDIPPHQSLKDAGLLVCFEPNSKEFKDAAIIFVSHQWCSKTHPDPRFVQFPVLQAALKNMISGELEPDMDLSMIIFADAKATWGNNEREELKNCYVWFDYAAIPQLMSRGDSAKQATSEEEQQQKENTQKAVDSIAAYVACSKYFFVLAPVVKYGKEDCLSDDFLQFSTWSKRGWCRLERMARVMAPMNDTKMLLITAEKQCRFIGPQDYLHEPACAGEFAYEDDRAHVAALTLAMIEDKLSHYKSQNELHLSRCLKALTPMFCGCADERIKLPAARKEATGDAFLKSFQFESAVHVTPDGWTPLHYAAMQANIAAMAHLIKHSADIHAKIPNTDSVHFIVSETTPIALATRFGTKAAVEFLLTKGAHLNAWAMSFQVTPVIHAGWAGNLETLQTLLQTGADIDSKTVLGISALDSAIMNNYHSVASYLLRQKASTKPLIEGMTPLMMACLFSGTGPLVKEIIQIGGCDPNQRLVKHSDSVWFNMFFEPARKAFETGERSEFSLCGWYGDGMTPLMAATITGKIDVADVLMLHGASTDTHTHDGLTLADLAKMRKLPDDFCQRLTRVRLSL